MVTIISIVFVGTNLDTFSLVSTAIIVSGIMSLVFVRKNDGLKNYKAALLATITGGFIAAYSLVDGFGVRIAVTALGFYGCLSITNAIFFSIIAEILKPGVVKTVIKKHRILALKGGFASFTAYALIIWTFTMAPIAIVTALRETSIIFALFPGVFFLKERLNLIKVFSSITTLPGICLLRINR